MERIKTGIDALDRLLQGGIPAGSTVLVVGRPGSGKTILAHQIMRGTAVSGGQNFFRITADGIDLFPRLQPNLSQQSYDPQVTNGPLPESAGSIR